MLKIAWSNVYAHPLPDGHRFPMEKYNLIPEQLLYEGTIDEANLFEPKPLEQAEILSVHDAEYWQRLKGLKLTRAEERRSGFPHSRDLIEREQIIMNGTVLAAEYALKNKVAMNLAGGTHHAFTNRAEGFCLLNDMALAASYLLRNKHVGKILIVDLDVHQGNGTAQIFEHEPMVFTFSMHGEKNYPMKKEVSDFDVELEDGTDDKTYLKLLDRHLKMLFEQQMPDFVFYQSGVDVLETDKLGRLGMTIDGCKRRDEMLLNQCKLNDVPLVATMGGGYSKEIKYIVEAHANTYRLAQEIFF